MTTRISALAVAIVLCIPCAGASAQSPSYPAVPYPTENPYSPQKEVLGKILFWEEQLSSDNTVACGTCHTPAAGGSDPRAVASMGTHPGNDGVLGNVDDPVGSLGVVRCMISGELADDGVFFPNAQSTDRKSPSFLDAMFADDTFWDGRARSQFVDPVSNTVSIAAGGALESQAVGPPVSDVEMACENRPFSDITQKISVVTPLRLASNIPLDMATAIAANPTYPALFNAAFGTPAVTIERIAFAIATYERALTSNMTPWDDFNNGNASALTAAQQAGLTLFNGAANCHLCHPAPLFTDNEFHNIGLVDETLDPGRQNVTLDPLDAGKFKTPSLRNVGLREPGGLFHTGTADGDTLDVVVNFYDSGGTFTNNIDPDMMVLNLTPQESSDLVDFIRHGLTDPRAAAEIFPFDRPTLYSETNTGPGQNPLPFPGSGFGDLLGNTPVMIAAQPPSLQHPAFTLGVSNALGASTGFLALGDPALGEALPGGLPNFVTQLTSLILPVALAGNVDVPGEGHGSFTTPIPPIPGLVGYTVYAQWWCYDPLNALFGQVTSSDAVRITILP